MVVNGQIQKGRLLYYEPNNGTSNAFTKGLYVGSKEGEDNISHDNRIFALEEYNNFIKLEVIIPERQDGSCEGKEEKRISLIDASGDLTDSFVNASYSSVKGSKFSNCENLGIESINIDIDSHMYPQVHIKFTDVRAYSLMQPAMMANNDKNYTAFFNAIFKFPYPRFLLTVKGYYGPPIIFELAVNEFTSGLNSNTGNFDVTVSFIGFPFGLLSDVPMNLTIIAPYINTDEQGNPSGYWEECKPERFMYADKGVGTFVDYEDKEIPDKNIEINGKPLLTFVEYIKATNEINKKLKDTEGSEVLGEVQKIKDENEQLSLYNESYRGLVQKLTAQDDFTANGVYIIKKKEELDEKTIGEAKVFNEVLMDYKLYVDTEKGSAFYKVVFNSSKEFNEDVYGKTIDDGTFWTAFKQVQENGKKIENEKEQEFEEKAPALLKSALGFEPFIMNYFRMTYAHLDTFFHYFFEVVNNIINNKEDRIPKNLGLNYDNSDLSKKTSLTEGFVPPFPAIYNKKGELQYPGTVEGCENIEEVKFVEKLLKAALISKKKTNEYLLTATYQTTYELNSDLQFIPTSLYDAFWNINPYSILKATETNFRDVLYLFMLRTNVCLLTTNNGITSNSYLRTSAAEAVNYFYTNPNPSEDFKRQLKDLYNNATQNTNKWEQLDVCETVDSSKSNRYISKIWCIDGSNNTTLVVLTDFGKVEFDNPPFLYDSVIQKEGVQVDKINSVFSDVKNINDYNVNGSFFNIIDENSPVLEGFKNIYNNIEDACGKAESLYNQKANYDSSEGQEKEYKTSLNAITGELRNCMNIVKSNFDTYYEFLADEDGEYFPSGMTHNSHRCYVPCGIHGNMTNQCWKIWTTLTVEHLKEIDNNKEKYAFPRLKQGTISKHAYGDIIDYFPLPPKKKMIELLFALEPARKNSLTVIPRIVLLYLGKHCTKEELGGTLYDIIHDYYEAWAKGDEAKIIYNSSVKKNDVTVIAGGGGSVLRTTEGNRLLNFYLKPAYLLATFHRNKERDEKNGLYHLEKKVYHGFIRDLCMLYGLITNEDKDRKEETKKAAGEKNDELARIINDEYRLSLYLTLKKIYDKWLPSYKENDFKLISPNANLLYEHTPENVWAFPSMQRNFFSNTVFIDSLFNRIGTELEVNPRTVYDDVVAQIEGNSTSSFLEFISKMCGKNKMILTSIPRRIYNGMQETLSSLFQPTFISEYGSNTPLNTYVALYPHDVSHFATNNSDNGWDFSDDGVDLQKVTENTEDSTIQELFADSNDPVKYNVHAFGVTYGKGNQSYFTDISVNMSAPRLTDFAIANVFELGNLNQYGGVGNVQTVGQDMYAIYSNRAYNCVVTMLGDAGIMPMMYFQLNNVPMFRGAYMITKVEHFITPGNMQTKIHGTRISKNLMPYNKDVFNFTLFKDLIGIMTSTTPAALKGSNGGDTSGGSGTATNVTTSMETKELIKTLYTDFKNGTKLKDFQVAGVIANVLSEGQVDSITMDCSKNKDGKITSWGPGGGLFGFYYHGRLQGLMEYCDGGKTGKMHNTIEEYRIKMAEKFNKVVGYGCLSRKWHDNDGMRFPFTYKQQVDFVIYDIKNGHYNSKTDTYENEIYKTTSAYEAAAVFCEQWERPQNAKDKAKSRWNNKKKIINDALGTNF